MPLTLTGTVTPSNATNQNIVWWMLDAGTTGATITGNTFFATANGKATIRTTIEDGLAVGTYYTQNFDIQVGAVGIIETYGSASPIQVYPNPTSGELRVDMCDMRYEICDIRIFDVMGGKFRVLSFGFRRSVLRVPNVPKHCAFAEWHLFSPHPNGNRNNNAEGGETVRRDF